jgi:hypothetical protein
MPRRSLAQLFDFALHGQTGRRRRGASRLHSAVDLDQTDPATTVRGEFRIEAQMRDIDAGLQRRRHERLAVLERDPPPVQGEMRLLVHGIAPNSRSRSFR